MSVLHERMNAGKVMTSRSPRFMSPWKAVGRVHTKPHHGRGAGHVRSNVEPRWRSGRKCGAGTSGTGGDLGAGGGGAGYIRINTNGNPTISGGVLSPAATTPAASSCYSVGTL